MDQQFSEYKPLMRVSNKNKRRGIRIFPLFALTVMLFTSSTLNAAGSHLDYSFNSNGKEIVNFGGRDECLAVAIQSNGKIVIAGETYANGNGDIALARFNANGLLDSSFNGTGKITTDFLGGADAANSMVIQPDGKILVSGYAEVNGGLNFAVLRYNINGSLDTSFSGNGKVFFNFFNTLCLSEAMALQADGKVLVAGSATNGSGVVTWAIARLTALGSLDGSFGANGKVTLVFGGNSTPHGIVVQPNGKIVVSGTSSLTLGGPPEVTLARYNANGSLDTTFGNGGIVITDLGTPYDAGSQLRLMADGRIVVAGSAFSDTNHIALVRYNSNGSLDPSFGSGGKTIGPKGFSSDLAINTNGSIIVAGGVNSSNGPTTFAVTRFDVNGRADASFGTGGQVRTLFGNYDQANSIALQSDGKIVAAGTSNDDDFVLARYNQTSTAANSDFGGNGRADFAVWRPSNGTWYVQDSGGPLSPPQPWGSNGDIPAVGDYDRDGKIDFSVYRPSNGTWYVLRSSDRTIAATQFGVAEDKPQPGDYDGDGFTDIAVWRPSTGVWYLQRSARGFTALPYGLSSDQPTPGDYDGDGLTDIGVFRPSTGVWYLQRSQNGSSATAFGLNGDKPVPADYDGDGSTDVAVWRPSTGVWYFINLRTNATGAANWGLAADIPAPADFDGDGITDFTVFRPSTGIWYVLQSNGGIVRVLNWGQNGDVPIPSGFGR